MSEYISHGYDVMISKFSLEIDFLVLAWTRTSKMRKVDIMQQQQQLQQQRTLQDQQSKTCCRKDPFPLQKAIFLLQCLLCVPSVNPVLNSVLETDPLKYQVRLLFKPKQVTWLGLGICG